MIVLTAKASANATVQRFRLRSTSEPPPSGPLPPPTPNAPESPASFPECMRIRAIRTIEKKTWLALRNACTVASLAWPGAPDGIQLAQDLDRLGAQLAVGGAPILL